MCSVNRDGLRLPALRWYLADIIIDTWQFKQVFLNVRCMHGMRWGRCVGPACPLPTPATVEEAPWGAILGGPHKPAADRQPLCLAAPSRRCSFVVVSVAYAVELSGGVRRYSAGCSNPVR